MTNTVRSGGLLCMLVMFSGCASTEITSVRTDIDRQMPDLEITSGRSYSFGLMSIGLARFVTRIVGVDEPAARTALRNVRRVKVGRYDVSGTMDASTVAMPARLRRYVDRGGWTTLATVRDEDEAVWILYRSRGNRITDLFVTVLSDDELVLARISGSLDKIALDILEHADIQLPFLGEPAPAVTEPDPIVRAELP